MKKHLTCLLLLLILFQTSCKATSTKNKITSQYFDLFNKSNGIIEIRLYDAFHGKKAMVIIINKAANKHLYAEDIMIVQFKQSDSNYKIYAFDYNNYAQGNGSIYDLNHKKISTFEIDREQQFYNKKQNIIARKKQVYFEDFFYLPTLGEQYLNRLTQGAKGDYCCDRIAIKKGFSVELIMQKPLKAKINIYPDKTIEEYKDIDNSTLIRILEPGKKIDLTNLEMVERLAYEKITKYETLMNKIN